MAEGQNKMVVEEVERQKRMKESPVSQSIVQLKYVKDRHLFLKKLLEEVVQNKSDEKKESIISACDMYGNQIQGSTIPFIRERMRLATPYLRNPWLADKFLDAYVIGKIGSIFTYIKNDPVLLESSFTLQEISNSIDKQLEEIDSYIRTLEEEGS
jgi:hypothetical protein